MIALSSINTQVAWHEKPLHAIVIMGVAGCGKSSLAAALAKSLNWALIEGDDFHPESNRVKMRQGIALNDADRSGWLSALGEQLLKHSDGVVMSCSALKRSYRDKLRSYCSDLIFVCLNISPADALARVTARAGGHLFPPSLVDSQFADFEPPDGEAHVLQLLATDPLSNLHQQTLVWLERIPSQQEVPV